MNNCPNCNREFVEEYIEGFREIVFQRVCKCICGLEYHYFCNAERWITNNDKFDTLEDALNDLNPDLTSVEPCGILVIEQQD